MSVHSEELSIDPQGGGVVPPSGGVLPPGQVRVWSLALDRLSPDWARRHLGEAERQRMAGIAIQERARRYAAAHAGLRVVLAACAGARPDEIEFEHGLQGKPRWPGSALAFNLSHAGGRGLIGVSTAGGIGVDIEEIRTGVAIDRLVERFFSPREQAAWAALGGGASRGGRLGEGRGARGTRGTRGASGVPDRTVAGRDPAAVPEDRRAAFFAAWVRKEAYAKGRGEGIARGLGSFTVTIGEGEAPRLIDDQRDPTAPRRWELGDLFIAAGYAAAVAYERGAVA